MTNRECPHGVPTDTCPTCSAAHTPTPYVVNGFGGDYQVVARLEPHGVAISSESARGGEIETASFIVRACNSHDALVAALEKADEILGFHEGCAKQQIHDGIPYGQPVIWINGEDHADLLAVVRAALKADKP